MSQERSESVQHKGQSLPAVLWFVNVHFTDDAVRERQHAGTGGWLIALAAAICSRVNLHIAAVNPYGAKYVSGNEFKVYSIKPRRWRAKVLLKSIFNRPLTDGYILDQMYQIIEQVNPDLIHIHGTEKGFIEILPNARDSGPPVLVSLQGILSAIVRQYVGGFDRAFLRRFWYETGGSIRSLLPKRLVPEYEYLMQRADRERRNLISARYIDGRTAWDRRMARLLAPDCEYFHIDRVLREPFYQSCWSPPDNKEQLCAHTTMGNSLSKGLDTIAQAAVLLEERGVPLRWTIAGIAADSMIVKAVQKKMGSKFPSRSLLFLGQLTADDLILRMNEAHVYVMASYSENSPNNLAEAMILGMPCIATFTGGAGSYLQDSESGLLVQPGDSLGVAAAMLELFEDRQRAVTFGGRARTAALNRHSVENVVKQVLQTYDNILQTSMSKHARPDIKDTNSE